MIHEDHLKKSFREFFSQPRQAGLRTRAARYAARDIPMVKTIIDNREIYVMEGEYGTAA